MPKLTIGTLVSRNNGSDGVHIEGEQIVRVENAVLSGNGGNGLKANGNSDIQFGKATIEGNKEKGIDISASDSPKSSKLSKLVEPIVSGVVQGCLKSQI